MAWQDHKRPTKKMCRGYGRKPHECLYDKDFPMHKRTFANGTSGLYAGPLCKPCRRAYERDLRRMDNKLAGKAGTMGDIQLAVKMVENGHSHRAAAAAAHVARETIKKALAHPGRYERFNERVWVQIEPFEEWFQNYLRRTRQNITSFFDSCEGVTAAQWYETRAKGSITINLADKIVLHAGEQWILRDLEDRGAVYHEQEEAA